MKTRKTLLQICCLPTLLTFAAANLHAVATTWNGSDGNWSTSANWSAGNPGYTTNHAIIQEGNVTVNSAPLTAQYLLLVQGANGAGKTATLTINTGANLGMGTAADSQIGTAAGGTGTVIHNAGTVSFDRALILGGTGSSNTGGTGTYTLNGGSFSVKNDFIMGANTASSSNSYFNLNGGTATLSQNLKVGGARYTGSTGTPTNRANVKITNGATLNVIGDYTHGLSTYPASGTGSTGRIYATTEIIGSKATINITGNLTLNDNIRNFSTFAFTLDDGGVSKINLTGAGTATLAGTLTAGFNGGLALTTTNRFTLIEANTGEITGSFATVPSSALWTTATETLAGNTRDAFVLTLNAAAKKGTTLDAAIATNDTGTPASTTFAASTSGYVEITGLTPGQNITLFLTADFGASGKTAQDLATWFTDNGIAATALTGSGDYNLSIAKTATATDTTAWLAWDLSTFNTDFSADAKISALGIATTAIPEPATLAAFAALAILAFAALKRIKN
ncbi:hypothetical protein [Geminisphaera colitermitum]|uniref:hypothetical protein n=1 Tax=Geminisphaera colitermitum TaxID=1148786 RepID=UPI0009DCAA0B|nr:hypothetical protein [Geminisphaera colitermitum]